MTANSPEVVYRPDMVELVPYPDDPTKKEAVITLAAVQRHLEACKQSGEEPLRIPHVINRLERTERPAIRDCMFPPEESASKVSVLGVRADKAEILAKLILHPIRPYGIGEKGARNFERYVMRLYGQQTT